MDAVIVIPARFASSRFPGKPMHPVAGVSMLERVWRIAMDVPQCSRVLIATEDNRIAQHAGSFGAEAVITSDKCTTGTERVHEALKNAGIFDDVIVNLQGDAVLTPPWVLGTMIDEIGLDETIDMVTPAVRLTEGALNDLREQKKTTPTSGTTVVFDLHQRALYFSKNIIPYIRKPNVAGVYRHIGLYGYRRRSLDKYVSLPPTPLELAESLEQLRALEHGMTIRIAIVDYRGRTHGSIDSLEDVARIESIIASEGELVDM